MFGTIGTETVGGRPCELPVRWCHNVFRVWKIAVPGVPSVLSRGIAVPKVRPAVPFAVPSRRFAVPRHVWGRKNGDLKRFEVQGSGFRVQGSGCVRYFCPPGNNRPNRPNRPLRRLNGPNRGDNRPQPSEAWGRGVCEALFDPVGLSNCQRSRGLGPGSETPNPESEFSPRRRAEEQTTALSLFPH